MEQTLLPKHNWEDILPPPDKPGYLALPRTTDRVLQILLGGNLARLRADSVAESLGMSSTTLRRRLRADHTCYQFLLDRARAVAPWVPIPKPYSSTALRAASTGNCRSGA